MNPIQRPTQQMVQPFIGQKIDLVYNISQQIKHKNFDKALQLFQQYKKIEQNNKQNQILSIQIHYNQALTLIYNGNIQKGRKQLGNIIMQAMTKLQKNRNSSSDIYLQETQVVYLQQLKIRILLTILCIGLQNQKDDYIQQINCANQICQVLRDRPQCLKQCFGRITGSQTLQQLHQINQTHIQAQTDIERRAIMYGIASDWKYIIKQKQLSLKYKRQALALWERLNRLKQSKQYQRQINEFKKHSQKKPSFFIKRLQTISQIVQTLKNSINNEHLNEIKQIFNKQKTNYSSVTMKVGLSSQIASYQQLQQQRQQNQRVKNISSSLKKSTFKNQKIKNRFQNAKQFYEQQISQRSQKNGQVKGQYKRISPILYSSRYLDSKYMFLRKKFVPFNKFISNIKKQAFKKLKQNQKQNKQNN